MCKCVCECVCEQRCTKGNYWHRWQKNAGYIEKKGHESLTETFTHFFPLILLLILLFFIIINIIVRHWDENLTFYVFLSLWIFFFFFVVNTWNWPVSLWSVSAALRRPASCQPQLFSQLSKLSPRLLSCVEESSLCVESALSQELTTARKLILKKNNNIFVTICIEMLFCCVLRRTH